MGGALAPSAAPPAPPWQQAARPGGRRRLQGSPPPCSGECQAIQDVANGWEGHCLGLQLSGQNTSREQCRGICCKNADCEVWQWGNRRDHEGDALGSCYTGRGLECSGDRFDDFLVLAGQRISHGTVAEAVPLDLGHWCIGSGMQQAPNVRAPAGASGSYRSSVEECRSTCYDDPACSIWELSTSEGCWFGFSDACTRDAPGATTMVAGERVARSCKVGWANEQRTDYVQVFGIIGAVAVVFACCATAALLVFFAGDERASSGGGRPRKSRVEDSETE